MLERFFSAAEIDRLGPFYERLWRELPARVVVDNLTTGRRGHMNRVTAEEKNHPHKVNDLYLDYDEIRRISLDARLVAILSDLLPDTPVLCNTLSLDYGSEQGVHADSLYMTPRTPDHLAASWIALEDAPASAGPLVYYPGSHKIAPYVFSNGRRSEIAAEHGRWKAYVDAEIQSRGLQLTSFVPHQGDVFLWHAQLLHGGGARSDPRRTRKSLVSHYFTAGDCRAEGYKLVPFQGAYWMDRPPQSCPGESVGLGNRMARAARAWTYRVRQSLRRENSE